MSRTAKIAAAGALGGLLMALSVGMAHREAPRVETIAVSDDEAAADLPERDLRRCRTLTVPDSGCEAAWEEKRRRFFGKGDRP